jgi:hypothetical protein
MHDAWGLVSYQTFLGTVHTVTSIKIPNVHTIDDDCNDAFSLPL